jgi:predicted nucleic acid-binding protein
MTFSQIPAGEAVFLDANPLIYHFANHPQFGAACTQLVERVELRHLSGFSSAHMVSDVAHRLMTLEAIDLFGWPQAGVVARLRKHRADIPKLSTYLQAVSEIPRLGIQVVAITQPLVEAATRLSRQHELLAGDALIVAVMQANGLTHLASADADFDRVPGITRYAPV